MNNYKLFSSKNPYTQAMTATAVAALGAAAFVSYYDTTSEPLYKGGFNVQISEAKKVAPECLNLVESVSDEVLYARKRLTLIDLQNCADQTPFSSVYNSEFKKFDNYLLHIEKTPHFVALDGEKLNKEIEDLLAKFSDPFVGLPAMQFYKTNFILFFSLNFLMYTVSGVLMIATMILLTALLIQLVRSTI